MRLLWPRILYWLSFVFLSICLFYAITGISDKPGLDAKTTTQTGAGVLAAWPPGAAEVHFKNLVVRRPPSQ